MLCTGRSRSARTVLASSAVTTGYSEASTAAIDRSPRLAAQGIGAVGDDVAATDERQRAKSACGQPDAPQDASSRHDRSEHDRPPIRCQSRVP